MSYLKCKDCLYFLEGEGGIIYRNKCGISKYHPEYDYGWRPYATWQENVIGIGSPCDYFESAQYTCGQCSRYREGGRCTYKASFFGLIGGGKHSKDKPACKEFKPADDCFLTSACVEYMCKPDDCEELTALRAFRDTYMKSVNNGKKLIEEYYEIAPEIVKKINASGCKNVYYEYIYSIIKKCVDLLSLGKNEETLREYQVMVLKLKSELL